MEELSYFKEGWKHIISTDAIDHQLFILVLAALYTLKDWKQVLILVTAFTIGHSITLALSTYEILTVQTDLVEFLIPCTIAFTASSNLFIKNFNPRRIRLNYFLALFFGLIHGLGFANILRFIKADDESLAWPLLQFNLGLEAGQVVVVLVILILAQLAIHHLHINRRYWVMVISAGVLLFSLKMAAERFPY
jgi:hypothetical protein